MNDSQRGDICSKTYMYKDQSSCLMSNNCTVDAIIISAERSVCILNVRLEQHGSYGTGVQYVLVALYVSVHTCH